MGTLIKNGIVVRSDGEFTGEAGFGKFLGRRNYA
jgi:hypothetical protein